MIAFLVLLYSVYLVALVVFGVLLRTGVLPWDDPVSVTIVPAALAGGGDRRDASCWPRCPTTSNGGPGG